MASETQLPADPLPVEAGGGEGAEDEGDVLLRQVLGAVPRERDLDAGPSYCTCPVIPPLSFRKPLLSSQVSISRRVT